MSLTAKQLKEMISEGRNFLLLDVRTPEEFSSWRIPQAVNIPLQNLPSRLRDIQKAKQIVTICAHGPRSQMAAEFLSAQHYHVQPVHGGMTSWNSVYDTVPIPVKFSRDVQILQVRRLGKGCIGYFVISKGEAAVIDPSIHTQELLAVAEKHSCKITKVLDTHQHADHLSGARQLAHSTAAELFLNPLDSYQFSDFTPLTNRMKIPVGEIEVVAIHTPGHTKGSTSFLVEDRVLITGDTLFIDGVARPDLREKASEFAEDLFLTYQNTILSFSSGTEILPGHFSSSSPAKISSPLISTLKTIRKVLPVLELSRAEFVNALSQNPPPKPPNYLAIIDINKSGKSCDPEYASGLEEGANRCILKTA